MVAPFGMLGDVPVVSEAGSKCWPSPLTDLDLSERGGVIPLIWSCSWGSTPVGDPWYLGTK